MFEKIELLLRKIEASNEEISIILSMTNISFVDYIMIKRGEMMMPDDLGAWTMQSLDNEVANLKEAIDGLTKIRKEVLSWN